MRAITIIQPWATLIALGEKKYETRSWTTKHRGEIAIHAGKKINKNACNQEDIHAALKRHGYSINNLPTGAIIATAIIVDCLQSIHECNDGYILSNGEHIYGSEELFGDFDTGRYAWQLSSIQKLKEPILAKGQLSLWNWDSEQFLD